MPGSVDLNSIPDSMIERVEILQDGASTIYGSDAIAGVVNIITKQGQDGFVASAQLGDYLDHGDGFTQNYQLSWGNGTSSSTQIVVGGNYVKSNGVSSGDRALSAFPGPYSTDCVPAAAAPTPRSMAGLAVLYSTEPADLAHPDDPPSFPADFRVSRSADRFNHAVQLS